MSQPSSNNTQRLSLQLQPTMSTDPFAKFQATHVPSSQMQTRTDGFYEACSDLFGLIENVANHAATGQDTFNGPLDAQSLAQQIGTPAVLVIGQQNHGKSGVLPRSASSVWQMRLFNAIYACMCVFGQC